MGPIADADVGMAPAAGARLRNGFGALIAAAALCAFLAAAALAAAPLDFIEPASSPEGAGDTPSALAEADLDGDGDRDLAVANQLSDNVTVLKNNGAGNFFQPSSSPEAVGALPTSIVAADLDGDSDQDLAVTNQDPDNVTVLKNNGSGNFFEPASSPVPVGVNPSSIVAVDLDGDADRDLAVANVGSSGATILLNNGSGKFTEPATSPEATGANPFALVATNVDGDADRDLAVMNIGSDGVTILKNNGSADFTEPASSPEGVGDDPISIAAGDLDGDADSDLAVSNLSSHNVTILRNSGSGNFNEPGSSPESAGAATIGIGAADIDGDADLDLAVTDNTGNSVAMLRNNGAANFAQVLSSPEAAGLAPTAVAFANFDGDADVDLAVANVNSDDVTILINP